MSWSKSSWRQKDVLQLPIYKDEQKLKDVLKLLETRPPLVFMGEIDNLKKQLANVANGKAFLLQGGDCAESFKEFSAGYIKNSITALLKMAVIILYGTDLPIVKIGRIAGQFSKPRSSNTECINNVELPAYRGDIANNINFTKEDREPNPERMLEAYNQSAQSLNLIRAFCDGGFADLFQISNWNVKYTNNPNAKHYSEIANSIQKTMKMLKAIGLNSENTKQLSTTNFYTSHEALLLPYEEALTRKDTIINKNNNKYIGTHAMGW